MIKINDFTFSLYKILAKEKSNIFFSAKNIFGCFAMVYCGSNHETKKEMQKVFSFPESFEELSKNISDLNNNLYSLKSCKLLNANGIWAQQDFSFKESYINLLKNTYKTVLKKVNYKNELSYKEIASSINNWVSEKTNNNIKELVDEQFFNKNSILTLISTIYFLGSWKNKFDSSLTAVNKFYCEDGRISECCLMNLEGNFLYCEEDEFSAISIPYNDNLSMVIVLPTKRDGLSDLEKKFSNNWFNSLKFSIENLKIFIPKWKSESSIELIDSLQKLGLNLAISDDKADFSNMIDNKKEKIKIGKALHKACINVDENGTEASVATAMGMVKTLSFFHSLPKVFRVDSSFSYFIKNKDYILFSGRVSKL